MLPATARGEETAADVPKSGAPAYAHSDVNEPLLDGAVVRARTRHCKFG